MATDACPACRAPVVVDEHPRACARCTLMLRREGGVVVPVYPRIQPSPALFHIDLRAELLPGLNIDKVNVPGAVHVRRDPQGIRVDLAPGKALAWVNPYMRLRDACVCLRLAEASGGLRVGAVVRSEDIDGYWSEYGLFFSLAARTNQLVRMVGGGLGEPAVFTGLTDAEPSAASAQVGPWTVYELRAQGPMLEGLCSGTRTVVAHDATLGDGRCGFRLEAKDGPATAVIAELSIHAVIA